VLQAAADADGRAEFKLRIEDLARLSAGGIVL
jgi:hypothetical protein